MQHQHHWIDKLHAAMDAEFERANAPVRTLEEVEAERFGTHRADIPDPPFEEIPGEAIYNSLDEEQLEWHHAQLNATIEATKRAVHRDLRDLIVRKLGAAPEQATATAYALGAVWAEVEA